MTRIRIECLKTGNVKFKFVGGSFANKLKKHCYGLIIKGKKYTIEG